MGIAEAILGILKGLLEAIPYFNKWFKKTAEQKSEEIKGSVQAEIEDFKKTGRPDA